MISEIKKLLPLLSDFIEKNDTNKPFFSKNIKEKEDNADELMILCDQLNEKIALFKENLSHDEFASNSLLGIEILYSDYVEYFEDVKELIREIMQSHWENNQQMYEAVTDTVYRKKYLLCDENSDIYLITYASKKIIINYNYLGIAVFNDELTNLHNIFLLKGIVIEYIYKNFLYPHLIALYCPESRCIICINLNNFYQTIIPLPFSQEDVFLLSIYFWDTESKFIVVTTNKVFYEIDVTLKTIQLIAIRYIENCFPFFYALVEYILANRKNADITIYDIHSDDYTCIIKQANKNAFSHIDLVSNITTNANYYNAEIHDVIYDNDFFVFIHEDFIIIEREKEIIAKIDAAQGRRFLRASFLEDYTKMAVLSNSQANYHCALTLYDLEL